MDCEEEKIVSDLLDSYDKVGGINHIDCSNLPSKGAVASICMRLLELVFPGFHDEEPIASTDLRRLTAERIHALRDQLEAEIAKSLSNGNGTGSGENTKNDREGHALACHLLESLSGARELLCTDVEAAYEGDPAARSFEEIIVSYPCIEAIAIQRLAHILYLKDVPLVPRMMTEWAHSRTGIDIHPGAAIGSHFFIDHGTGVVIGETCVIGNCVKLYHGVTLGARSFPKDDEGRVVKGTKRHPDVGDNVTIYPNATVLGGKTSIGSNSTLGANAYLRGSIPDNSLVAIEPISYKVLDKNQRETADAGSSGG